MGSSFRYSFLSVLPSPPTWEAPNRKFFRFVILRGPEFFYSPRFTDFHVNIFYFHMLLLSDKPAVFVFVYEPHSHRLWRVRRLLHLQNTISSLFLVLD